MSKARARKTNISKTRADEAKRSVNAVLEACETLRNLENILSGYMSYDGMVGGIVSQGCNMLSEARELLKKPTKKNIREVIQMLQTCRDKYSSYASQAPDMWNQLDMAIEKVKSL